MKKYFFIHKTALFFEKFFSALGSRAERLLGVNNVDLRQLVKNQRALRYSTSSLFYLSQRGYFIFLFHNILQKIRPCLNF